MKRNTSNWSNFASFCVARVCQLQLGFLVFTTDETADFHKMHDLRDDSFFHEVINVCMSSDSERLIGLVTAINSIYKNSKYPVKFHILISAPAYDNLM